MAKIELKKLPNDPFFEWQNTLNPNVKYELWGNDDHAIYENRKFLKNKQGEWVRVRFPDGELPQAETKEMSP